MNYTWVYLCCNSEMLELTLQYLPRSRPFNNLDQMVVVFPEHLVAPNFTLHNAPKWLRVSILPVSHDHIPTELQETRFMDYWHNDKPGWSLGIKQILPLVFDECNVLYTDDDVLILKDPWPLIERGQFCTSGAFQRLSVNKSAIRLLEALNEIFQVQLDIVDYNANCVDAGIYFIKKEKPYYLMRLSRMWKHWFYTGGRSDITEFRCSDQRFLSYYAYTNGWWRCSLAKDRRVWYQTFTKQNPQKHWLNSTTFIHYGASSHKSDYINWLRGVHEWRQ